MRPDAAATRPAPALRDPRLLALLAALLVHVAVLGPILLDMADEAVDAVPAADIDLVPIDLTPFAFRRSDRLPPSLRETPQPLSMPAKAEADQSVGSPVVEAAAPSTEGAPEAETALPSAWSVRAAPDGTRRRRMAEAMRLAAACRNLTDDHPAVERSACARRHAARADRIGPLTDPATARFEAEGAAQLAAYEDLRDGLRPPSPETRACPHSTDMMGRCPVQLNIPLFSSERGFLPGLKKDERE